MSGTNIPTAEETLAETQPILAVVSQALEVGTQKTTEYFEIEEREIDASLAPSLVRYHTKLYLDEHGHEAIEEEDYDRECIRNNGLALFFRDFHIKIWKAHQGKLPPAGESKSRQEFFKQPHLEQISLFPSEDVYVFQKTKLNLIILWDVTSAYTLTGLRLICPKKSGKTLDSVEWYWNEPVGFPIAQSQQIEKAEISQKDSEELDISLPETRQHQIEEENGTEDLNISLPQKSQKQQGQQGSERDVQEKG